MKRSQLALAIAGLVASSTSFAANEFIDITGATGANKGPNYWASEVSATQSSTIRLAAALDGTADTDPTGPLDVRAPLNIAIGKGDIRYLRVELSDPNAKFAAHPSCTLTAVYVDNGASTGHTCVRSLGGKDASFVTYAIQADGTNLSGLASSSTIGVILAADSATPTNGGIIVSNTSAPVKMTYSLHTNKDSAENASYINSALLFKKEFDYIAFSKVLDVKYTAGADITSNVADDFFKFVDSGEYGFLGTFSYGTSDTLAAGTNPAYISSSGGLAVNAKTDLTYIVGTGTTFTLASETPGGFSFVQDVISNAPAGSYTGTALQNVFLHTSATLDACKGSSTTGLFSKSGALSADKATFEISVSSTGSVFGACVKANGKSVIEANIFNGEFSPGANDNTKPEKVPGTVGKIVQNGTVLDTPYVSTIDGYISRVILTNTSGVDVKYSAASVTEDGATATPGAQAEGTVPAKSILQLNLKDVVSFSGKPRGSVRFTIRGSNQQLGGVYQVIKVGPPSGDVQSIPLIRKGGG